MSKKLSNNGFWESSRIVMPQHKEAINNYHNDRTKHERPELDEHELTLISERIGESYSEGLEVTLVLFDAYQNKEITGVVVDVDLQLRKIKLRIGDDVKDIKLGSIVGCR